MPIVTVFNTRRWKENEYEGEVDVQIEGLRVTCRAVANPDEWETLTKSTSVSGIVTFLRYGNYEKIGGTRPQFERLDGISYRATGTIREVDGECVVFEEMPWLKIDLDLPPGATIQHLKPGDGLRVVGQFELEL